MHDTWLVRGSTAYRLPSEPLMPKIAPLVGPHESVHDGSHGLADPSDLSGAGVDLHELRLARAADVG